MTEKNVKWEVDSMVAYLVNFDDEINNLNEQKDSLKSINDTIKEAWQGIGGMEYDMKMELAIANFEAIIEELSILNQDMRSAVDDCYKKCEDEISSSISALSGKIG